MVFLKNLPRKMRPRKRKANMTGGRTEGEEGEKESPVVGSSRLMSRTEREKLGKRSKPSPMREKPQKDSNLKGGTRAGPPDA